MPASGAPIEALEAAVARLPDDARLAKRLAHAYQQAGRPLDAQSLLVRVADLHVRQGAPIQAIAVCKWILELDPTHTSTLERLAALRGSAPARAHAAPPDPRTPDAGSARTSEAPLEEVMLTRIVAPQARADAEGAREIPLGEDETAVEELAVPAASAARAAAAGADGRRPDRSPGGHRPARGDRELERFAARRLAATPLFGRVGARALRRLIAAARLVRLSEGEVLFRQGDPADALYVVAEGAVVPIAEGATRRRLSVLEEGDFFGEIALVTEQPRNATVEALVESQLLAIDRDEIRELLDQEPEMLAATLRFLRQRLVDRLVRTSPLFAPLSRDERAQLARRFRLLEVEPGAMLIQQGHPAEALYMVLAGALRVVRSPGAGRADKELAMLGVGAPCGEMSLLHAATAMANVIAARRSWVLMLPRRDFEHCARAHPELGGRLARIAQARRRRNAEPPATAGDPTADASDLELV